MSKLIFTLLFMFLSISFASAECLKISESCVEGPETRIIEGVPVYKACWKYKNNYRCFDPVIDYCKTIKNVAGCEQVSSKCISFDEHDKKCNNYENIFKCGNLLNQTNDIIDLGESYTLSTATSTYNECSDEYKKENCDKVSSICVEGPESRIVDGESVFKECWKYKENYSCKSNIKIDNCQNIPQNCILQSSSCLADMNNICNHWQKTFYCSSKEIKNTNNLLCGEDVYCTNGQCEEPQNTEDSGFAKSISYLVALNEAAGDQDNSENIKIFTGQGKSCEKEIAGYNNCCKDSGWGQDYANASCSSEEKILIEMQSKKLCHYVGEYCSKKLPLLGKCQETTKTFCCFNSKISRVVAEQGRGQIQVGWGSAESPNCRGFTPEELQKLRFDQMDLSEISEDIINNTSAPNQDYIENKIKQQIESYE